jgi:hypothetical protein
MRQSDEVQAQLQQLTIICLAILSGVLIFAGVVWYLLSSGRFPPEELDLPPWIGTLFNVVALVALVKAHLLPRLFTAPGAEAPERAILAWHKRTTIVGFALREAAAVVALVGAMLTGQLTGAFALVGLAIVTMFLGWPRGEQLVRGRSG